MEAGIVGLPNVGKSTLFNALTMSKSAQSANYPFCTIEPNEGMVSVPDGRLQRITHFIPPQKVIPAALKLVDIAGIVKGASEGQGLGNKFLSHIREVDAILQVVRCFDDPDVIHVAGKVDPLSDMETIEIELMLADIQHLENLIPKAERAAKGADKDAKLKVEVMKKCLAWISEQKPLRTLTLDENEKKAVKELGLLTAKPILYVANVDETDVEGKSPLVPAVRAAAAKSGADVVPVCAKIEAEIAELDEADRAEMLEGAGLAEPALAVLARAAYKTLGLQSYFTAGGEGGAGLDDSRGRHCPAGRGRDPHRLREGLHPGRDLLARRPRAVQEREGDSGGREDASGGQGVRDAGRRHLPLPDQ